MFKLLALLAGVANPEYSPYQDPCKKDLTHLNLSAKIEMSIGCSEVQGMKAYNDRRLDEIIGE